jgi:hypothetical protein
MEVVVVMMVVWWLWWWRQRHGVSASVVQNWICPSVCENPLPVILGAQ